MMIDSLKERPDTAIVYDGAADAGPVRSNGSAAAVTDGFLPTVTCAGGTFLFMPCTFAPRFCKGTR